MRCFVMIKFMYEPKGASKIAETQSTKQEEDKKEEQDNRHGLERVTVGRVIDGDTFEERQLLRK